MRVGRTAPVLVRMRVAREGKQGALTPSPTPQDAPKYFLSKMRQISLFFSAKNPARKAYSGHSGVRNPRPPPRRVLPPRQIQAGRREGGQGVKFFRAPRRLGAPPSLKNIENGFQMDSF